jgi:hypothetical protein
MNVSCPTFDYPQGPGPLKSLSPHTDTFLLANSISSILAYLSTLCSPWRISTDRVLTGMQIFCHYSSDGETLTAAAFAAIQKAHPLLGDFTDIEEDSLGFITKRAFTGYLRQMLTHAQTQTFPHALERKTLNRSAHCDHCKKVMGTLTRCDYACLCTGICGWCLRVHTCMYSCEHGVDVCVCVCVCVCVFVCGVIQCVVVHENSLWQADHTAIRATSARTASTCVTRSAGARTPAPLLTVPLCSSMCFARADLSG